MRRRLFDPEITAAFKYLGTVSFSLALHVIGGFFLGRYLDERWGTAPILVMLGTILGAFTGFYGIYKVVMKDVARSDSAIRDRASRDRGSGDPDGVDKDGSGQGRGGRDGVD